MVYHETTMPCGCELIYTESIEYGIPTHIQQRCNLHTHSERMYTALERLATACFLADLDGDLSGLVTGDMMTEAWEVIRDVAGDGEEEE